MSWILIAIVGYILLGLVNIVDKALLAKFIPDFRFYTFLVGILGGLAIVLAPWGFAWPGSLMLLAALGGGAIFIFALLTFFSSLQTGEASRVIPLVGGTIPIFTLIFASIFLGESLAGRQMLAFGFLVLGGIVIARLPHPKGYWWNHLVALFRDDQKRKMTGTSLAILAGLFFAISFTFSKFVYDNMGFINGFIWLRFGSVLAALGFLIVHEWRDLIKKEIRKFRGKVVPVFFGNQLIGGAGFALQNWAIALGSVAIVNALQGVQYAFILAVALVASIKYPKLIKESLNKKIIVEKVVAIILIAIGLIFLNS
jgi:drug/metabolite transporter (DMT)-like permease